MNGDVIALAVDLIQALAVLDGSGKIPCRINGDIRIISINFHSKSRSSVCYHCPDGSQTDNSQLFTHDLASCELFLLFLSKLADIFLIFFFGNPFNTTYDITGCQEHSCQNQFLYAIGIGTWCVEYNNSLFCTVHNRDVIDTCTCTGNGFHSFRKFHIVHFRTSYQDCICFVQCFCFLIILSKKIQAFCSNRIQAMILIHYAFSSSNFFINATRASTPSFGIAL